MLVALINGEHHRNPSGCHNKVKWILSQCKYNRKAVEKLYSRFRNGELLCIKNAASHESWYDAFLIANWCVCKKFVHLPQSIIDKYQWLKAEYGIRRGRYKKVAKRMSNKGAMLNKKAEDSWRSRGLWYMVNADESAYKIGFKDGYSKARIEENE